jgi:exopolysaccharide production protein ExoQ
MSLDKEKFNVGLFLAVFTALPVVGLASGPAYAPLLFGMTAILTLIRVKWPQIDRKAALLAVLFLLLCAVELPLSITFGHSAQRLGQLAGIFLGCLLLLALPKPDGERLFPLMHLAIVVGATMLILDTALDYPLQRLLTGGAVNAAYKYNRGLISLLLVAWPMLGGLEPQRRWPLALVVAAALVAGLSTTGLVAFAGGGAMWLLARWRLRLAGWLLGGLTTVEALLLPWILRLLSGYRLELAPYIKPSGLHRLEIWDYMSARILERPFTGWGLGAAQNVPIRPEELANYLYVSPDGIYPHNQWIELWLETGLPGVLLALALVWLALSRAKSPYALAAIMSALLVSALNFEITTDSWWAALAASALLFQLPTRKMK